ncbi:Ubiquitin-conjugating enzyme [Gracilaria domingensis]|nr:Ubiquitin-conjugating enzyme [Gracilaria domingensis]
MLPNIELFDLVSLPNQTLAVVIRLPYIDDSSSEESSDEGEWTWPATTRRRHLISRYEDTETVPNADMHLHETPFAPDDDSKIPIPDGFALVANVLTFSESLHKIEDLMLHDRPLLRGNIVTNAANPSQSAVVIDVHRKLTVRRVSSISRTSSRKSATENHFEVDQSQIGFFFGLAPGDTVVRGHYVGVVTNISADVYVRLSDGSLAFLPSHDERYPIINTDVRMGTLHKDEPMNEGFHYPGQTVTASSDTWTQSAVWVRGSYTGIDVATVTNVRMRQVEVHWIAQSNSAGETWEKDATYVELVDFSDVTPLESFRESCWVVGDRGFLVGPSKSTWKKGGLYHATVPFENEAPRIMHSDVDESMRNESQFDEESDEWIEEDDDDRQSTFSDSSHTPQGRFFKAQRRARRAESQAEYVETSEDMIPPEVVRPEDVVQIIGTKTFVTLRWQDGTTEVNVPAVNLRTNDFEDGNDFRPGEIVGRKEDQSMHGIQQSGKDSRRGVIVRVNHLEKTAIVKWEKSDTVQGHIWDTPEEEISVYELVNDDYDYQIGDTALHLESKSPDVLMDWVGIILDHQRGEATVKWVSGAVTKAKCSELVRLDTDIGDEDGTASESAYSGNDDDSDAVRYFGAESGFASPELMLNWGSDTDSDTYDFGTSDVDYGSYVVRSRLEGLFAPNIFCTRLTEENMTKSIQFAVEFAVEAMEDRKRFQGSEGASLSRTEVALVAGILVTRAVSELLARSITEANESQESDERESKDLKEDRSKFSAALVTSFECLISGFASQEQGHEQNRTRENGTAAPSSSAMEVDVRESKVSKDLPVRQNEMPVNVLENSSYNTEPKESLPKFCVLEELYDFFYDPNAPGSTRNHRFLSVISKEWRRLRTSLPDGIIVRACERHDNILRVAIIGSEGTPYADIMFFFDVLLDERYPVHPPRVWFRSHGRRLNPNLYEDGKVCLSILGTWDGDDVESWDPRTSNLLRVLLSLQAFVFVEEPYYNEAGFGNQRGTSFGQNNSTGYNENVFLLCVKHIISSLQKSQNPADCYEMAVQHYKAAGSKVLARCRALINGDVARATLSTSKSMLESQKPYTSAGFKKSLQPLVQQLEKAIYPLLSDTPTPTDR